MNSFLLLVVMVSYMSGQLYVWLATCVISNTFDWLYMESTCRLHEVRYMCSNELHTMELSLMTDYT